VRDWLAGLAVALAIADPLEAAPAARDGAAPGAPAAAVGRDRTSPIALGDVLESARAHAPQVLEAITRVRAAEGRRLASEGAFDTIFSGTAETRLSGFYDGRLLSTEVTRPFAQRGGYVYGGYRLSGGDFPTYEDENFTNQWGELKIGAVFALLRDRAIDERRFALYRAETDVALAETESLLVAVGVQRRAIDAYLAWVGAGLRLAVFRDLLKIAEDRQAGFARQAATGQRPRIIVVENEQTILRRRSLVVDAERALETASVRLSLFWRGEDGLPKVPPAAALPSALPPPLPLDPEGRARALSRPDLKAIDLRIAQAAEQLRLDRNLRRPRLDLKLEASQDLGPVGEGGSSRSGTESKVGLTFSIPFEQRAADGRIAATRADIAAFELRRRQLEEEIVVALDALSADVRATGRVADLASAERDRASELARAEQRRLELGASDLFLTTVREEAAADAEVRAIDARLRQAQAHADVAAATADLGALGL
jgi:outer membrane protein TolC